MNLARLLLPLSLIALNASASETVIRRPATVRSLVSTTLSKGAADMLPDPRASNLGYSGPQRVRRLIVEKTSSTQLTSILVVDSDKGTPRGLIFSSTTVTEFVEGQPAAIDGYSYRADLNGKLVAGIRAHGKVDDVLHDKLDPKSKAVRARFAGVVKAFLSHNTLAQNQ